MINNNKREDCEKNQCKNNFNNKKFSKFIFYTSEAINKHKYFIIICLCLDSRLKLLLNRLIPDKFVCTLFLGMNPYTRHNIWILLKKKKS